MKKTVKIVIPVVLVLALLVILAGSLVVTQPDEYTIIKQFGADTARTFVMFAGPPDQSAAWSNSGAEGTYRFLRRLWNWGYAHRADLIGRKAAPDYSAAAKSVKDFRRDVYTTLKQAESDFDRMQYNTVVSAAMKMLNSIDAFKPEEIGRASCRERV